MSEEKKQIKTAHNLIMENRKTISVSGVVDVDSFDESTVVIFTDMGTLTVKGTDLHINRLSVDTGELIIDGNIISLTYTDEDSRKDSGFFSKLFR